MLTAAQKMLVQESVATIAPIADDAASARSTCTGARALRVQGAAVHTAVVAEQLAVDDPDPI